MAKGGKRPGAGRKPGVPNKANAEREAAIRASGLTPMDYFLGLLRDEHKEDDEPAVKIARELQRFAAAKELMAYCHPRLASIEARIDATLSHADVLDRVAQAEKDGTI